METQQAITPVAAPVANTNQSQAPVAEPLPWGQDRAEPLSVRTATARLERPVEVVHWAVVALTVLTAISVLFGAYGRAVSRPQELLPIVIDAR